MRNLFVNFAKFLESCKYFAEIFHTMVKDKTAFKLKHHICL